MQQVKKKRYFTILDSQNIQHTKKSHSDVLLQKKAPIFSKLFYNSNTVTTRYTTSFHQIFSTQKIKEKYNLEGEKTKL